MKKLIVLGLAVVLMLGFGTTKPGALKVSSISEGMSFDIFPKKEKPVTETPAEVAELKDLTTPKTTVDETLSRLLLFEKWGLARSAVEEIERGKMIDKDETDTIRYKENDLTYSYIFQNGGLASIVIVTPKVSAADDMKSYNDLVKRLDNIFGEGDKTIEWLDETYKNDDTKWVEALDKGHMMLYAMYESNTTKILVSCGKDKNGRQTQVDMFAKSGVDAGGLSSIFDAWKQLGQ